MKHRSANQVDGEILPCHCTVSACVCELNPSEETTSHGSAVCEEQQLYPVL